jgi:hypothetical protein
VCSRVRELDQIRPHEKDDIGRFGAGQATPLAMHRTSPTPESHRRSSLDNSDTKREEVVTARPGKLEQRGQEHDESSVRLICEVLANSQTVVTKLSKACSVGRRQCPYDKIDGFQRRKHVSPYDFPDPPFHAISFDGRMGVPGYDYSRSGIMCEGGDMSDLKIHGSKSPTS